MRKLIISAFAALGLLGGAAAAAPALASTGPHSLTSITWCPANATATGENGTQVSASGLDISGVNGELTGTAGPTFYGSCFYWATPPKGAHTDGVYNPKEAIYAPGGAQDDQAITLSLSGQVVLNSWTGAASQILFYNGDGTWSFASNPGVVLILPGPGKQLSVARYNPADVLASENLTFAPGV